MKKSLLFVAIATLFMFSCQKELEEINNQHKGLTFKASIENLDTKADMDASYGLVWAAGDKIGIYTAGDKVRNPFTLDGAGGTTVGQFSYSGDGTFDRTDASGAYFPWQDNPGAGTNNIWEDVFYISLPEAYYSYTSGKMLTPLVAPVTYSGSAYAPISFKHAGAAVKVTINNLPAGAHSIGMTADKQIYGDYSIAVADAGSADMTCVSANSALNTIWLNYEPASTERAFTFVFPVPAITTPKLSFVIYDENGIIVWQKALKAQNRDLGRADVLNMPALDITPYSQFTSTSSFTVIGTANGTNWDTDFPMVSDGSVSIAKGLTFAAGGKFKVRENADWSYAYGNGDDGDGNTVISAAGTYDIIFDNSGHTMTVVESKCPYPSQSYHPALERQWGWYSGGSLWTDQSTVVAITHPENYGMARSLAMDDDYIYLPKSSAYANAAAISIADPSTQQGLPKGNITGGSIFTTSFARVIKNTDFSVNGGKDVLLVCNLTETNSDSDQLRVWAYKDGINTTPTQIAGFCYDSANSVNDWRRYGDRFFVTGTYQDGKLYFPSFNPNKIVVLSIANGARTAVTQIAAGADNSTSGIKDITVYPGDNKLFITNASIANLVAPTGGKSNGWDEYTLNASSANGIGTWGYNFFKFNGKSYIAYARTSGDKAWIEVIEDKGDLISSLSAQDGLLKAPIHHETNLDAEHATGGVADCCVRIINGVPYIAALTRDGGLVVYKLVLEQ